jgi:hypothetical protein
LSELNEKTVKIGGLVYTIQECDDPRSESDEKILGDISYTYERIRIERAIPDRVKRVVLLHEIVHGVLEHAGHEQDEQLVQIIGYGLSQVLMDNQWIVDLFKHD